MVSAKDIIIPPDCDLRDFRFMPLEVERLRRSKAWLIAKRQPELGFYMMNLWMAVWHEVPAASIEDDDDVLADAAMCDPKKWAKVREHVLRGWVKGSDGRLYHPVVAEKAREAWADKQAYRKRTAAARAAKQQRRGRSVTDDATDDDAGYATDIATSTVTEPVTDDVTALKGEVREREGKGKGYLDTPKPPPSGGFDDRKNGEGSPRANGTNPRAVARSQRTAAADLVSEPPWEARCRSWVKGLRWDPMWGPDPSEPNCHAPLEIVERARRQKASPSGLRASA